MKKNNFDIFYSYSMCIRKHSKIKKKNSVIIIKILLKYFNIIV